MPPLHTHRARSIYASLILAAAAVAPLHAQDDPEPMASFETRRFALPCVRRPVAPVALKLVPYERLGGSDFEPQREELEGFSAEDFLELAQRVLPDEPWSVAGAELRLDEDGRLVARGRRSELDELGRLIDFVSAELLAEQLVDVELHPLRASETSFEAPGAVLESAQVERLLAEAQAAEILSTPQRWTLRARAARCASAGGLREQSFVRDLDVEVSQGAVQADPWSSSLALGTAVHLRADARRDGVALLLFCERHEELGGSGERELFAYREFYSERSVLQRDLFAIPTRQPSIGFGTLALSLVLPAGRELLCVQQARGPRGSFGHVLRVRPRETPRRRERFENAEVVVVLRDLSELVASRLDLNGPLRVGLLSRRTSHDWEMCSRLVGEPAPETASLLQELVESSGEGELELACYGALLFLVGENESVARAERWLDEREQRSAISHELRLEFRDRTGQRLLAELSCALRTERDAFFSMGADELGILDYDLEVAHGTSIYDPVIDALGHGVLGRVRTTPLGERAVVELELALHWTSAIPQRVSILSMNGAELDLGAGVQRMLQETYVLGRGESASSGDLDPAGPIGLVLHVTRRG